MITKPSVKILADSQNSEGFRLTTFEINCWEGLLPSLLLPRSFSRSFTNVRVYPMSNLILEVEKDPWGPSQWNINGKGAPAVRECTKEEIKNAEKSWIQASKYASLMARGLQKLGIAKQITNKLLSPFAGINVIITADDAAFIHWFKTWETETADPSIKTLSKMMHEKFALSVPDKLKSEEWHLPGLGGLERIRKYCQENEISFNKKGMGIAVKSAAARISRVALASYGKDSTVEADLILYDKLISARVMHPLEHIVRSSSNTAIKTNYATGWDSLRQLVDEFNIKL